MPRTRYIPFKRSATLGRGFNTLTGEVVGKALNVISKEQAVSGGDAKYDVQIVESQEALMQSLGLSVEASGRYGMFSAEGKFELSENSGFNATSTFVVASCRIQNAFEMIDRVEVLDEAKRLLEDREKFKQTFGNAFVRGLQTGGEFYSILQVTSESTTTQSSLGASFQAACQGLIASADFEASYKQAKTSTSSRTETRVIMYQRGGQDEGLAYTKDPSSIIQRLVDFPRIARANPGGYEFEVADYNTLALPAINEEEIADRELALADCAKLRLKYMTRRNDIAFARENRVFFADLPPDEELGDLWEKYSRAVGLVQLHAQRIAGRSIPPTIFDLSAADPNLTLPVVNLRRVDVPSDTPVPDLVGSAYSYAKRKLAADGLAYEGNGRQVQEGSGARLDTVEAQEPAAGTLVPPKFRVRLSYNYIPSRRFPWEGAARFREDAVMRIGR